MFAAPNMTFARSAVSYDADALVWINGVETQDAQSLEVGVKLAMNQLLIDAKALGVWTGMSNWLIKMGARTLNGALVNIKTGTIQVTNNNFVAGDYNRTAGLAGNASNKSIYFGNLTCNTLFTWVTTTTTNSNHCYIGNGQSVSGAVSIFPAGGATANRMKGSGASSNQSNANVIGFLGVKFISNSSFESRGNSTTQTHAFTRVTANPRLFAEYACQNTSGFPALALFSNHRSCASGYAASSVDLANLQTVMNTYRNSIIALGL